MVRVPLAELVPMISSLKSLSMKSKGAYSQVGFGVSGMMMSVGAGLFALIALAVAS